jgi:hypothetical protein
VKNEAIENREAISRIKMDLALGLISYSEAKNQAEPIIAGINKKSIEIAKKYGMKPKLVSFATLMR